MDPIYDIYSLEDEPSRDQEVRPFYPQETNTADSDTDSDGNHQNSPLPNSDLQPLQIDDGNFIPIRSHTSSVAVSVNTLETSPSIDTESDFLHPIQSQRSRSVRANSSNSRMGGTRRSSVIMADTGAKVYRTYSFWEQTQDELDLEHNLTSPLQPDPYSSSPTADSSYFGSSLFITQIKEFFQDPVIKGDIKAGLAYFIASLAVYSTTISDFLGVSDSKHLVCTTVVYFHATRTKGDMIQSVIFVFISLSFAFIVSVIVTAISSFFLVKSDVYDTEIGDFIQLIFSCSALGVISFVKLWMNQQTFDNACSLAAIVVVACIIKEGSLGSSGLPWAKIYSIFLITMCGCVVSVGTCYLLWPTSAETTLKDLLNENSNILSTLLKRVSFAFLKYENLDAPEMNTLVDKLKSNLSKLETTLLEAKFELYVKGREKEYLLLEKLVESCERLATIRAGLRRSVDFKWELVHNENNEGDVLDAVSLSSYSSEFYEYDRRRQASRSTYRDEEEDASIDSESSSEDDSNDEEEVIALDSKELFDLFVYYLGPSMKSFSFTVRQILSRIPFDREYKVVNTIPQFIQSLKLATGLFNQRQEKSIKRLYDQDLFKEDTDFMTKVHQEDVAASCGNFTFLLLEFSRELTQFLEMLKDLSDVAGDKPGSPKPERTYNFLKLWKRGIYHADDTEVSRAKNTFNDLLIHIQGRQDEQSHSSPRTNPSSLSYRIWRMVRVFKGVDVQFGIRVAIGTFCISIFGYLDKTKYFFNAWRAEWGLVAFCIIMNKSVGGTTMTFKWRFIGTLGGALYGYVCWVLFFPNVWLMSLTGFLFSIPCFHIILTWKVVNGFGRFILLAYNLTILYSYTRSQNMHLPDDNNEGGNHPMVFEIGLHRFVGVTFGSLWAVIITMTLFPNSARSRIRRGLSILWLRMGIIWHAGPLSFTTETETGDRKLIGIRDRNTIHVIMSELEILLTQAPIEIRLKGPFPTDIYRKLLNSTTKIIDAFENLNSIIDMDKVLKSTEHSVLVNMSEEMTELENRVFLVFYMLASAMKLGFPLASKPASTEHAKKRMLVKLSEIRNRNQDTEQKQLLANEDFVLLYSYNLVVNSITNELDVLLHLVAELYGMVSEDTLEL